MLKKLFTVGFIILGICVTLLLPVGAQTDNTANDKANALKELTIMVGSDGDLRLQDQVKRSEAATLIVRLLGAEAYVLQNKDRLSATKFSDVPKDEWYAPYVGFCAENKIINGYDNGKFGPSDNVSEKAFLKLVLCALGYNYGIDFTYDGVYKQAYNAGLVQNPSYLTATDDNNRFTRGDVVSILYNSLSKEKKDVGVTLINNLINSKAITKAAAIKTGFLKDEPVTQFTSLNADNSSKVTVTFNEKVKQLKQENIQIYETANKNNLLSFTIDSSSDSGMVLKTNPQTPELSYTVEVNNIEDMDGNVVNSIIGNFTGFKPTEVKSDLFRISKIESISKNDIEVYFTQPINMNAELPSCYEILQGTGSYEKGTFENMAVKVLGDSDNALQIFLKDKDFTDGINYTLKINGSLTSVYGAQLGDGSGDSMNFTGNGSPNEGFYIENVTPIDPNTLEIAFSKDVDASTAQQIVNYSLKDNNGVSGNFFIRAKVCGDNQAKGKVVRLVSSMPFASDKTYELTVKNVNDSIRQNTIPESVYPFSGKTVPAKTDLTIFGTAAIDKRTLSIYTDRELDPAMATNIGYYSVIGTSTYVPSKVYYDPSVDPYLVKLYFSSDVLGGSGSYKVRILNVMQDVLGRSSTNNSEMSFTGSGQDYIKPMMVEAKIISKDTIKVSFNEEISSGGLNTASSNYVLEYKEGDNTVTKNASSVSYLNADTLLIKFDSLDFGKSYTLKFVTSLTDYSNLNTRVPGDGLNSISVMQPN